MNDIMSISSNRSSSIPISFDRFRVRTIHFLSPFRSHQYEKRVKKSPERLFTRKLQVHPHQNTSSERIDHDASYLFHANKQSDTKTTPLSKNPPTKKNPKHFFNTRPTSNIIGAPDFHKLPVTNAFRSSQSQVPRCPSPPTPSMIRYRYHSLPTFVPTRIVRRPKSYDDTVKQTEFDQIDQLKL